MKIGNDVNYVRLFVMMPFLFHLLLSVNALGGPCNDQVVSVGETMNEVAAKCGEAALKEKRTITVEDITTEVTGTIISTMTTTTTTTVNEWTYYFGPGELVQSYRFEKGRLKEIISNGYQNVHDFSIDLCRDGKALAIGDSTVETYMKCGEPIVKEGCKKKVIEGDYGINKRRTIVPVVEWTYRYGPDAPGYTVTFENGVAANIRTREFGK